MILDMHIYVTIRSINSKRILRKWLKAICGSKTSLVIIWMYLISIIVRRTTRKVPIKKR